MLTQSELNQLKQKGISVEALEAQLSHFKTGFPYLRIESAATPERGISVLSAEEQAVQERAAGEYGGSICKFVPASGAASRMFKDLFEALNGAEKGRPVDPETPAGRFVREISRFPFFDAEHLLRLTLYGEGLGYGSSPKGLILFHKYPDGNRTSFEEHLVEGAFYARDGAGRVRMTVTVSPEHEADFRGLLERVRDKYERRFHCRYDISFTTQSPSTDVIAADTGGNPFRKSDGELLFRPGGHGALLRNLNEVDADIAVIKNIDNVVKESLIGETVRWKKILIGRLVVLQRQINAFLERLEPYYNGKEAVFAAELVSEAAAFLDKEFCMALPESFRERPAAEKVRFLYGKLNRPVRVCGMVKNEGEPGGGPFIIGEPDGTTSLQILESAQIDAKDPRSAEILRKSTHFNPVDLVCSLRNYKGEKFDLMQYADPKTGFISFKSYEGRVLMAQELPGLWNGAMSRWNTQFVEVPSITFNPVKTVLDLLRPAHCD